MSPKPAVWKWSEARGHAALLVAEDDLTDTEIAARVGISKRTLERWKQAPEFGVRVDEHLAAFTEEARRRGIGQVRRRVAALQDRWHRMQRVITERAADPTVQDVPGGPTGLLVRRLKGVGSGEYFQVLEEAAFDDELLRELRAHEEQAARELGQWAERRTISFERMTDAQLVDFILGGTPGITASEEGSSGRVGEEGEAADHPPADTE